MIECDLIMKGGITSGVVYPQAVVEIAGKYRLRNVGGTSAGAIAAVVAAAAEHCRQSSLNDNDFTGFEQIRDLAEELAVNMRDLFQPTARLAPLFEILLATVGPSKRRTKVAAVAAAVLRVYPWHILAPVTAGLAMLLVGWLRGDLALAILGIVTAFVVTGLALCLAIGRAVFVDLPRNDFGICSGLAQSQKPALTEWLSDKIDRIAGNAPAGCLGNPLTVGQLEQRGITVAAVTTDLSSRRPFQLPLKTAHHFFSKEEFEALFPKRVIDYLVGDQSPLDVAGSDIPKDLYPLPIGPDFPVLLVARMSLSFPGLISAVPLYRYDDQLKNSAEKVRRCLFSDGGISSNFPIHFFDTFLPNRPTFGITLVAWDAERHADQRVSLPDKWRQSTDLRIGPIRNLPQFLDAIFGTAREWQDTLQSLLPGYAERIVEIRLDNSREGGLNLAMEATTIEQLSRYGREAGRLLVETFDFDEHRWRRALSLLPELEDTLRTFAENYDRPPAGSEDAALTYAEVLTRAETKSYKNSNRWREGVLSRFARSLATIGTDAEESSELGGKLTVRQGNVPTVDSRLRLIADTDRGPAKDREPIS